MKKYTFAAPLALACAIFLLQATSVQASTFRVDFDASNFKSAYYGTQAPQNAVSGSITFETLAFGAAIEKITSVDLMIDGYQYQSAEIGTEWVFDGYKFFGNLNGGSIAWGTNDFWIFADAFNQTVGLTYASDSVYDGWNSEVQYQYSQVPEPATPLLALTSLAAVGLARRRRRQIQ